MSKTKDMHLYKTTICIYINIYIYILYIATVCRIRGLKRNNSLQPQLLKTFRINAKLLGHQLSQLSTHRGICLPAAKQRSNVKQMTFNHIPYMNGEKMPTFKRNVNIAYMEHLGTDWFLGILIMDC